MSRYLAVTTYAPKHWESHARRCVESFNQYWEKNIPIRCFTDEMLYENSSWLKDFKKRHAHRDTSNYRLDAVRFAHKIAAIDLAYQAMSAEVLIWIDADCVTHSPVDQKWLDSLLGDADFALLKRGNKYPECGFMMFAKPRCNGLVFRTVDMYREDTLFRLPEWHDSYIIDHVQRQLSEWRAIKVASLSGDQEHTGHPFVNGPLGTRMDHLKGKRKFSGRSMPRDLKVNRTESYWQ